MAVTKNFYLPICFSILNETRSFLLSTVMVITRLKLKCKSQKFYPSIFSTFLVHLKIIFFIVHSALDINRIKSTFFGQLIMILSKNFLPRTRAHSKLIQLCAHQSKDVLRDGRRNLIWEIQLGDQKQQFQYITVHNQGCIRRGDRCD